MNYSDQFKNIRSFIARLVDYFDSFKGENVFQFQKKMMNTQSNGMLYDLAERAIAVESIFFIYDHFKYIQFRVTVKFIIT